MFSEKINTLMTLTGASAADLAALAGFDRSNISSNDLKTLCSLTGANENDPFRVILGI